MIINIKRHLEWFLKTEAPEDSDAVSSTRDIFQARLDRMYREFAGIAQDSDEISLLTAVVGEIGNNCFDHN